MMQVDRREKYQQMRALLNEKQWRQYLALEAKERGSISVVVQEAGASPNTIRRGIREIEAEAGSTPGERQRQPGGGRKKLIEKDASLQADLEGLLDPKGDPMSLLRWTSKSVAHLKTSFQAMGHRIADTALRDLLLALGYRLAANKKNLGRIGGSSSGPSSFSRRVELHRQASRGIIWLFPRAALVTLALHMALARRHPQAGLLHHSDRGSEYTSRGYQALLADLGIVVSMSRTANCYDHAAMESFFDSLKSECVDRIHFQNQAQARSAIFEYLECWYNPVRLHSTLEYVSPLVYEQAFAQSVR